MAGGVTVGFTPVLGAGTIAHGASGQAAAAEDSPLGLFDALLQIATGDFAAGSQFLPANDTEAQPTATSAPDMQAALGALFGQQLSAAPELAAPEGDTAAAGAPADIFMDVVDVLTALQSAAASGEPVDPALERKAKEALDAIAALLGVPVPQAPIVDPAITAAATVDAGGPLDPLATIDAASIGAGAIAATVTPAGDAPETTSSALLPAPAKNADAAALGLGTAALSGTGEGDIAAEGELPPIVKELAEKLTKLAASLEQRAPLLAERLTTLAEKLGSGKIDTAALAKLGFKLDADLPDGELETAIARLLTPAPEHKPSTAPASLPFAPPGLVLPDSVALPPKAKAAGPADTQPATPAAPAAEPEAEPESELLVRPEPRTADRADKPEPQASARNSFAAALQQNAGAADSPPANTNTAAVGGLPATAPASAETKAIHAAYSAPVRQINIPQVAFEIVRQVQAGASRFQIRLDPPELGRVDVKLDVDAAGNINARMTVERAETLDLMQRDQRSLERALAQAGLDGSKTNLEFSLRQNPFAHQEQQNQGDGNGRSPYSPFSGTAEGEEPVPAPHVIAYRGTATAGGVNLFV